MNNFTVYMHTAPDGRKYIGITQKEPKERWNYGSGYAHNWEFHKVIKEVGWSRIKHEILYTGLSKEEAQKIEMKLIREHRSSDPKYGFNCTMGGGYSNPTIDTKRRIAEATAKSLRARNMAKPCICLETNQEFPSLTEAAKQLNISSSGNIGNSCRSNGKFLAGGYHFVFADPELRQYIANTFGRKLILQH